MTNLDIKLESAGVILGAVGASAPLEVLQVVSATAAAVCGVLAVIKAGIKTWEAVRAFLQGKKTAAEAVQDITDAAQDLREEVDDNEAGE